MNEYSVKFKATYLGYVTIEAKTEKEAEEQVINALEDDAGFFLEAYAYDTGLECEAMPVDEEL